MTGPAVLLAQAYSGTPTAPEELRRGDTELLAAADELTVGQWERCLSVVEGLAAVGDRGAAAELYPVVLNGIDLGAVISWSQLKLWQMVAGIIAACGAQWDAAEQHFETALRQANDLPHQIAKPEGDRRH